VVDKSLSLRVCSSNFFLVSWDVSASLALSSPRLKAADPPLTSPPNPANANSAFPAFSAARSSCPARFTIFFVASW
jgi:hypothetical protein